jgi:hypothetical protein
MRIEEIQFGYEDYTYRAPLKFGGTVVDRATLLNVNCVIRNAAGKTAKGFGSMPMGNIWSFPSKSMPYDTTLNAMKALAGRIRKITADYRVRPPHRHQRRAGTGIPESRGGSLEGTETRRSHPETLHPCNRQPV